MKLHKYAQIERSQHRQKWKKLHRQIIFFTILAIIIFITGIIVNMSGEFTAVGLFLVIFGNLIPVVQQYQAQLQFEQSFNDLLLKQLEANPESTNKPS